MSPGNSRRGQSNLGGLDLLVTCLLRRLTTHELIAAGMLILAGRRQRRPAGL
jgi:hypothetical protein